MTDTAIGIQITGIVQGVGFRPFVYKLAGRYGVRGWVANTAEGVEIVAEGSQDALDAFAAALEVEAPPLARIEAITVSPTAPCGCTDFVIRASSHRDTAKIALVSPDVAVCPRCREELLHPADRRYRYPFINCTDCGPRFTIIQDIPYDRPATTMRVFAMCPACQGEYDNPASRRFHAQPNACPVCGPAYRLLDRDGQPAMPGQDVLTAAASLIAEGAIVAVKGIGGYHLAVNARDEAAVTRLRVRKNREEKPLAVMAGSLAACRRQCLLSPAEQDLLTSAARPIVLLAKGPGYSLADSVAPGNPCLGVMLPYAPVHYLLLGPEDIWVMTSGNVSDEPVAYQDNEALSRLKTIADYFLVHNRDIHCRADDSVVRVIEDKPLVVRRSRGYVPAPIKLRRELPPVLAAGGELKNTFCLTRGQQAFLSAHIGDLANLPAYEYYIEAIAHLQKLLAITPELAACDLHPEYLSTKYAQTLGLPLVAVQHHHAHIAAVMAEHGVTEPVIGVAFDGTGYGPDGTLWGGEFLVADLKDYRRAGHLAYLPLPGGDKAIRQPWRLGVWLLKELYGQDFVNKPLPLARNLPSGWELVLAAAEKGINTPLSSGAGRLFDAAAALLGIRQSITYEGQAAIELELAARGQTGRILFYDLYKQAGTWVLDFKPVFAALCHRLEQGAVPAPLAADFHTTLAAATCDMVRRISKETGITKVALSGGVFQNVTLLTQVVGMLSQYDYSLYLHRQTPPNDGGLALGQAAVAGERS